MQAGDRGMFRGYFSSTSREETRDILISVGALTLAFFIYNSVGSRAPLNGYDTVVYLLEAFVGMVTAFLLHELSHRYVARSYGGIAYFRMWPFGIVLALLTSLIGFIFAAPGAVNISGIYGKEQMGKTALAGPMTNLALGIVFLGIFFVSQPGSLMEQVFYFAAVINLWFSLFNMIPFPPLDGSKVISWNIGYFAIFVAVSLVINIYIFI
jgi:Zn-dependent protease